MDFSNRFSLVDFLAYLFPGVVATLGLYILLLLTPLKDMLRHLSADLATGILFLIVSFILGVVFSGFSEIAIKWREPEDRARIKSSIPLVNFENDIVSAFRDILKPNQENAAQWSKEQFYLCRSLVIERMPNCAQLIQRQIGLRQLRMNLAFPMIIWFFAGLGWGIHQISNSEYFWGVILIAVSVSFVIPAFIMILNRMDSNERREVREVLSAFLAGYRMGIFDKVNKER
jgi:hypothetical protein